MDLNGLRVTVVGLGKSGMATAAWLGRRGARVSVSESRPASAFRQWAETAGSKVARTEFGGHTAAFLADSDLIVASPGVPPEIPALREAAARGVAVVGDIEVVLADCPARIAAVSGTNGKTTTTALLGALLREAGIEAVVAGNIGVPVAEIAESLAARQVLVLEVSSFQLDTAPSFHPLAGVLLNVTPDHLDRYASYEAYARSKARLFANQEDNDVAVLNGCDEFCAGLAPSLKSRIRWFDAGGGGEGDGAAREGDWMVLRRGSGIERIMPVSEFPLPGKHNLENALAACATASVLGAGAEALARGLRAFPGVPHRLERAGAVNGIEFVNDSKATNEDALDKALRCFTHPVVLIAGGRDKGADFARLSPLVAERVKAAILMGEAAERLESAWLGVVPLFRAWSMEEAVRKGRELAAPRGTVLLSPGCASYDMFDNFEHRGEIFRSAVRRLAGGAA